jgi:hypothetical protein
MNKGFGNGAKTEKLFFAYVRFARMEVAFYFNLILKKSEATKSH